MHSSFSNFAMVIATTAALAITIPAGAQTQPVQTAQGDVAVPAVASATGAASKTEQRKHRRAERRAARKVARAKNSAELKKLENAGYEPGNTPNYPKNVQDAEKKAQGQ